MVQNDPGPWDFYLRLKEGYVSGPGTGAVEMRKFVKQGYDLSLDDLDGFTFAGAEDYVDGGFYCDLALVTWRLRVPAKVAGDGARQSLFRFGAGVG